MAEPVKSPWSSVKRTASQTRWQSVTLQSNTVTRKVTYRTNSFVELGAGLNITNASSQFVSANPSFTITPTGAEARGTAHQIIVPGDIGSGEGVKIIMPGGEELVFQPLAIDYFDPVDGQGVLLDVVTNAVGWLVASNEIIFSNCFVHIKASIRLRNTRAGLESDLILHESPPEPQTFGLSSSARLEMLTEQLAGPVPAQRPSVLQPERDPVKAATMLEPHLVDTELTYGTMKMGAGRAFLTPSATNVPAAARSSRVAKSFLDFKNRKIIIEAVEHRRVRPALLLLPPATKATPQAGLAPLMKVERLAKNTRRLPALPVSGETREAALRNRKPQPVQHARLTTPSDAAVQLASASTQEPAFVLDYVLTLDQDQHDFTFRSDTTYWVSTPIGLSGTTTIEGGTVIKFSEGTGLFFFQEYGLVCDTTEHLPAVFTSYDDNSVGENIGGNSNPVQIGTWGLYFISGGSRALSNVRFTYLSNPIAMEGGGSANDLTLRNVQVRKSDYVVDSGTTHLKIYNGLFVDSGMLFSYVDTFVGEHLTVHNDTTTALGGGGTTATIKNSLLVKVASPSGYGSYNVSTDTASLSDNYGVFTTVEGGKHYLAANSTHRNQGTTIGLDLQLYASLPNLTTYAPEEITGTLSADRTLSRRAIRDTALPDRGYHYPAVDYLVRNVTVGNATLKMQNGVVVAGGFNSSQPWSPALQLVPGKLISQGTATRPNCLLRANQVQENVQARGYILLQDGPLQNNTKPEVTVRFTEISSLAGEWYNIFIYWDVRTIEFSHSTFYSGLVMNLYGGSLQNVGLTNNLFRRTFLNVNCNSSAKFNAYNNLLKDSALSLYGDTVAWRLFDNVFDHTDVFEQADQFGNDIVYDNNPEAMGHNAFVGTDHQLSSLNESFFASSLTYASGPLGRYYVSGATLQDAGSRTANNAGLFHFTTSTTSESKEQATVVDIGLHYPSLAANGSPQDADADGLADYLEDSNGNGAADASDLASFNKWDTDEDGMSDGPEYQSGTNPQDPECPRDAYEAVISSQIVSGDRWFKLNDTGLGDAMGGLPLINSGGTWAADIFAKGNSGFSFASANDDERLKTVDAMGLPFDVINGGDVNFPKAGSVSLLFRSLTGVATSRRWVFCQRGQNSNNTDTYDAYEFSVFFEDGVAPYNPTPVSPGVLYLQIGGQRVQILAANAINFATWYYLAVTWDENRADANGAEVTWYLGTVGGTLTSSTINLVDDKIVGNDAAHMQLGNRDLQNRSLRGPGSGALDEIVFWNRELTDTEVNAQFDTLNAPYQGPSKVFDLTRWNLMLPVDNAGGFSGSSARVVSTTQLSSGFQYVDPNACLRNYFYRNGNTMVFETPWNGTPGTAGGTSPWGNARSELRGTLANGNEHNWTASSEGGSHALNGTCRVNVAGTGKVVIGQIHSDTAPPANGVPAIILHYDTRVSPTKIIVTVKHHPHPANQTEANLQTTHEFAGVGLDEEIRYQLKIDNDPAPVTLHVKVNDVEWSVGMNANSYSWDDVDFHFKAGCYYPDWTGRAPPNNLPGITAKVTFYSLTVTP